MWTYHKALPFTCSLFWTRTLVRQSSTWILEVPGLNGFVDGTEQSLLARPGLLCLHQFFSCLPCNGYASIGSKLVIFQPNVQEYSLAQCEASNSVRQGHDAFR